MICIEVSTEVELNMVIDKEGYAHLIQFLTENLSLFEVNANDLSAESTMLGLFEEQLAAQITMVCGQNLSLDLNQRNKVIRVVDAIAYDISEVLGDIAHQKVAPDQVAFITEFSGLIKNLFDQEIAILLGK